MARLMVRMTETGRLAETAVDSELRVWAENCLYSAHWERGMHWRVIIGAGAVAEQRFSVDVARALGRALIAAADAAVKAREG